ncbi:MAG: GNAT family N-acetyltransferase [Oscillospiraceae bacterium]|nr:GNAT family N-acetyltransferase [Oscillospiraceae bacterium]
MKLETKRIETKRLILRPFQLEDAHDMFVNWASDPEVTKYLSWPAYTKEQDAVGRMHWMRDQYAAGNVGDWAIELKEIGQVIGSIGIVSRNDNADSVHIGYCIGRRWWHQGITSEAFSAVIDYCFSEGGVNRIETRHAPANPYSGAVMRKCGLRYEGTLRQSDRCNAGITDADWYAILKEDRLKGRNP